MKRAVAALAAAFVMLPLCGCVTESSSQRAENQRVLEQAKKNAQAYISEKYGFDAEVTGGEIIYDVEGYDFIIPHSSPTTTAKITMRSGGRDFNVIISGKDENTYGADNYQENEITQAFGEFVCGILGDDSLVTIEAIPTYIGTDTDKSMYLSRDQRFDGSNFTAALSGMLRICVECAGFDLSDTSRFSELDRFMDSCNASYAELISYRSKDALKAHPVSSEVEYNFYVDSAIEKNAAAVAECRIYTRGEEYGYRNYSPDAGDVDYRDCCGVKYHAPEMTTLTKLDITDYFPIAHFTSIEMKDVCNDDSFIAFKTSGYPNEFTVAMPLDMYSGSPENAKIHYITDYKDYYGEEQIQPAYCDDKYIYATMTSRASNDFCFFFAP